MPPDQLMQQIRDGKVDPSHLSDHELDSLFEEPTFGESAPSTPAEGPKLPPPRFLSAGDTGARDSLPSDFSGTANPFA